MIVTRSYTPVVFAFLVILGIFILGILSLGNSEIFNSERARADATIRLTRSAVDIKQAATADAIAAWATEAVAIQTAQPPIATATAEALKLEATRDANESIRDREASENHERRLAIERTHLTFIAALFLSVVALLTAAVITAMWAFNRMRNQNQQRNTSRSGAAAAQRFIEQRRLAREMRWKQIYSAHREHSESEKQPQTVKVSAANEVHSTTQADAKQNGHGSNGYSASSDDSTWVDVWSEE